MFTRTKFKVKTVTEHEKGLREVTLDAVTGGSPENESFFKWTPNGRISLGILNPEASAHLTPGKEFYVDFTEVQG